MTCNETHNNDMERYMNENATTLLHDLHRLYNAVRSTGNYFELVTGGNGRLILTNKKASKRSDRFTLNEVLMHRVPHAVLLRDYLSDVVACGTKYGLNASKTFVLPVFCARHRCLHLFFESGLSFIDEHGEYVHEENTANACPVHYASAHFAQLHRIYGSGPLWAKMREWVAAGILSPLSMPVAIPVSYSTPKRLREDCEQNVPAKRVCVEVTMEEMPVYDVVSAPHEARKQVDLSPMDVQEDEREYASPLADAWPVEEAPRAIAPTPSVVEPDVEYPVTTVAALLAGDDDLPFDVSTVVYEEEEEADVNMLRLSSDSGDSELMSPAEEIENDNENDFVALAEDARPLAIPLQPRLGEAAPMAAPSFYGETPSNAYDCDANGMPFFPFDNDAFVLDEEELQRCLMQAGAFAHGTFSDDPFAELQYMQN